MKTLLIIDANLGQARAYMAKTLLGAARKAKLEIIDNRTTLKWRLFSVIPSQRQRAER